jgi:hypothetical protein
MNSYIVDRNRKPWKDYRALLRTAPSPGSFNPVKDSPVHVGIPDGFQFREALLETTEAIPNIECIGSRAHNFPARPAVSQDSSPILLGMEMEEE